MFWHRLLMAALPLTGDQSTTKLMLLAILGGVCLLILLALLVAPKLSKSKGKEKANSKEIEEIDEIE